VLPLIARDRPASLRAPVACAALLAGAAQLAAGCSGAHVRTIAVRAAPCGVLSGDGRASDDWSGTTCAVAARLRLYPAPDFVPPERPWPPLYNSTPIRRLDGSRAEACADLTRTPFDALFASGGAGGALPTLLGDVDPASGPLILEVALYAPGGASPCPADAGAPMLALGRSGVFDLSDPSLSEVDVPLGIDPACDLQSGLALDARWLEDDSPAPAPDLQLGEIFPYELTESDGTCNAPAPGAPRGESREYATTNIAPGQVQANFAYHPSPLAGCTTAIFGGATTVYGCLGRIGPGVATLWRLRDDHLQTLAGLWRPDAKEGTLAVRVRDKSGAAAVGARVIFDPDGLQREAIYADDDLGGFSSPTVGASGIAAFPDGPSGLFRALMPDGAQLDFHAGAPDDPFAVATFAVDEK
jgi:hypothetical protein